MRSARCCARRCCGPAFMIAKALLATVSISVKSRLVAHLDRRQDDRRAFRLPRP